MDLVTSVADAASPEFKDIQRAMALEQSLRFRAIVEHNLVHAPWQSSAFLLVVLRKELPRRAAWSLDLPL